MKKMKKSIIMVFALVVMLLSAFSLNKGDAQAAGNYSIRINKATNVVTVYSNGKPDRAFVCSTGNATPIGTFRTSQKPRWHVLDGPSYGQYCTRIHGSVLFHSVWYYANGDYASQSYVQYNKLGTTASHGCVRLTVADSKWIYENSGVLPMMILWGNRKQSKYRHDLAAGDGIPRILWQATRIAVTDQALMFRVLRLQLNMALRFNPLPGSRRMIRWGMISAEG